MCSSIEVAFLPRNFHLPGIVSKAADVGDVEVMLGGAVERKSAASRKDSGIVLRIDAGHQERRDLDPGGVPTGRLRTALDQAAIFPQ